MGKTIENYLDEIAVEYKCENWNDLMKSDMDHSDKLLIRLVANDRYYGDYVKELKEEINTLKDIIVKEVVNHMAYKTSIVENHEGKDLFPEKMKKANEILKNQPFVIPNVPIEDLYLIPEGIDRPKPKKVIPPPPLPPPNRYLKEGDEPPKPKQR